MSPRTNVLRPLTRAELAYWERVAQRGDNVALTADELWRLLETIADRDAHLADLEDRLDG